MWKDDSETSGISISTYTRFSLLFYAVGLKNLYVWADSTYNFIFHTCEEMRDQRRMVAFFLQNRTKLMALIFGWGKVCTWRNHAWRIRTVLNIFPFFFSLCYFSCVWSLFTSGWNERAGLFFANIRERVSRSDAVLVFSRKYTNIDIARGISSI